MKKRISLLLSLVMLLSLVTPAFAAEARPTPPEWVKAEEYLTFPGDSVYEKETWDRILRLREDAAAGHPEPKEGDARYSDWNIWKTGSNGMRSRTPRSAGEWFERGLIAMQYAANSDTGRKASTAYDCFTELRSLLYDKGETQSHEQQVAMLWKIRARFLNWGPVKADEHLFSQCAEACKDYLALKEGMPISPATVWDTPLMDGLSDVGRKRIESEFDAIASRLNVSLNGKMLATRMVNDGREYWTEVVIVNGRTMMPLRWIAEKLGANVSWVEETKAARVVQAGVQIDLPIGSTTGYKNGVPFQMDVAPYVKNGATMVPVRYVAEFFGLTVNFNEETRTVELAENKGAVSESNLEAWALPMGAVLNYANNGCRIFGGATTAILGGQAAGVEARRILNSESWSIMGREDLIETVCSMTVSGHNMAFLHDVAMINAMTPAEYQQVLNNSTGMDKYMFPYTRQLGEKWGDRGILCWDLFRMSNLVQWGYVAGYLTYPEALALLEPAATLLHDKFKNWDEAYENYLDGYNWWARNNVLGQDIWKTERGKLYLSMKADQKTASIFDDALFQKPVVGVPNLTAEGLLTSIQ